MSTNRRRRRPPTSTSRRPLRRVSRRRGALHSYKPRRRGRSPARLLLGALVLAAVVAAAWAFVLRPETPAVRPQESRSAKPVVAAEPDAGRDSDESGPDEAAEAAESVRVGSYLGSAKRRLEGFGPAPEALELKWKLRIGSGQTRRKQDDRPTTWSGTGWTGQATVLAEKDRTWLFIGGYDHNLHKIDADTGELAWEAEWPDVMKGTNTLVPNPAPPSEKTRIIVVSGSRRGDRFDVGDPRIAPLRAVSAASGKELWRLPVPKTHNYSQDVDSSPLWYRGVLYAPVEPGFVYALDPFRTVKEGKTRRPAVLARSPRLYDDEDVSAHPDIGGANLAIEASPAAIGDTIYVTSGAGHIYGLDATTLEVVWDFKTGCDIDGTPVATDDGKLLVTLEKQYVSEKGGAYLLDPSKPPEEAVVWYYPTPNRGFGEWAGGSVGSVTMSDGEGGTKPRLVALQTVDGSVRLVSLDKVTSSRSKGPGATKKAPSPLEVFVDAIGASISTPVLVGDTLVCAGYGNKVHLYRISYATAEKDDPMAVPSADGRWWKVGVKRLDSFSGKAAFESTPLVYGGRVYIGCRDGYLYCLGD